MCQGASTLAQLDPAACLGLKITALVTETGFYPAGLKLDHTDDGPSDICHNEVHGKWRTTVCVHLNTSDAMSGGILSASTLNFDTITDWLQLDGTSP